MKVLGRVELRWPPQPDMTDRQSLNIKDALDMTDSLDTSNIFSKTQSYIPQMDRNSFFLDNNKKTLFSPINTKQGFNFKEAIEKSDERKTLLPAP